MKKTILPIITLLCLALPVFSGERTFVPPSSKDKCAVCGMFAAKYPNWACEVLFRDKTYAVFDGPKDLFVYISDLKKYTPARRREDIQSVFVVDYYTVRPINAFTAYYVIGSDVTGPMGRELVPFEKETDAHEFMKDHQGQKVLRFGDVGAAVLMLLEAP